MAIDYMGDVLGHDLYPEGCSSHDPTADVLPCPASTTFLHGPLIQVYLEKKNGEKDIFPDEINPMTERSIAELSVYGKDHAMEIVGFGRSGSKPYPNYPSYNMYNVGEAPPTDLDSFAVKEAPSTDLYSLAVKEASPVDPHSLAVG